MLRSFRAHTRVSKPRRHSGNAQIYKTQPIRARELLQSFSDKMLEAALDVTDKLTEKLFTCLAEDIQAEYRFAGA